MEKDYPEQWPCDVTPNVHFSLGLFLAQYLCNGFNLADEAFLTYDDYYYLSITVDCFVWRMSRR